MEVSNCFNQQKQNF